MNLCVFYPIKPENRGSFISMHIEYLKPKLEVYYHQYPIYVNGKLIFGFPMRIWVIRTFLKNFFTKLYRKIHKKALVKVLREEGINIALAEYGLVGAAVAEACKEAGVPLVVHFHGYDAYVYEIIKQCGKSYKRMFEMVDGIVGVSKEMVEELKKLGAPENKLALIPYGVDINKFSEINPSNNEAIFIAVGNFTDKKAPDITIKAFSLVAKENRNVSLLMIGDGSLLEKSKKLVKELGIDDIVKFTGKLPHNKISEYMGKARVFVQHSLRSATGDSEGSPVAIMEASARGLPVVSTRHAGIPEIIIDGETGFLVEEGDYEKMAYFMKKVIEDTELASEMGQKGRKHIVKNYNSEKQLLKLKKFIYS